MAALTEYIEPIWRGLDMRKLKVDEAYLMSKTFYHKVTYLYSLSDECYTVCLNNFKYLQKQFSFTIKKTPFHLCVFLFFL